MGQQQLLLLTLGIVIVGLATVVGIQMFSDSRIRANADAGVTNGLRIATDCQVWAIKPGLLGGMPINLTLSNCSFDRIGYPTSTGNTYDTVDGTYTLSNTNACSTEPVILSGAAALVYVNFNNADTEVNACIGISGTRAGDIGTHIDYP